MDQAGEGDHVNLQRRVTFTEKELVAREKFEDRLQCMRVKKGFVVDMDGVIYQGSRLIPGARRFLAWCAAERKNILFLTNNSKPTPRELQAKLLRLGLKVPEEIFYTSALSTASFLVNQKRRCTAFAIGEAGLFNALYAAGVTLNDVDPDYVVLGESDSHNSHKLRRATELVSKGARLIGTSPDVAAVTETGIEPACGAWCALVEAATGKKTYYCGKPNPIMMRSAVKRIGLHPQDVGIIGDRMDTDILAGIESELDSVLVLSGVTDMTTMAQFAYRPFIYLDHIGQIPPETFDPENLHIMEDCVMDFTNAFSAKRSLSVAEVDW